MDIKSMLGNTRPAVQPDGNTAPTSTPIVQTVDSEAVRGRAKSGGLGVRNTTAMLVEANKDAAIMSAEITAGNILNDRVVKIVAPKLPVLVRGYAETPIGKAALSNLVAGVVVNFMPQNEAAVRAADAMVKSAMLAMFQEFNLEEMVNELLDGITLPEVAKTGKGK